MDDEYLYFLIALLGLLEGMRLIPEGWVHFYKAPTAPHKLSDLCCGLKDFGKVVTQATAWWRGRANAERQAMFAAIHWFCFSGLYHHQFEEFSARYIVLDTLDWIHRGPKRKKQGRHAERAFELAKAYGLAVPSWAVVQNGRCRLADIRNEFVHEGRFAGEPIGFAHLRESSLILEFGHFLSRLIVATLGVKCTYVASPCNTRSLHGIGLI